MYYVFEAIYVCVAQMEGAAAWELQEPLSCKFQCVACAMFSNQLYYVHMVSYILMSTLRLELRGTKHI